MFFGMEFGFKSETKTTYKMKTILQTTARVTFLIFLSIFYISCSDSSEEIMEEPQVEPQGMTVSFKLNNEPITINFSHLDNSGTGWGSMKLIDNGGIYAYTREFFINENYEITLYFGDYFLLSDFGIDPTQSQATIPNINRIKELMFQRTNLGMKYIEHERNPGDLERGKYKGFTLEIKDKNTNKTYTSQLILDLYTEDPNSPYGYDNFMEASFFELKKYEVLDVDRYGRQTKEFYIEADFECKLLDYKINYLDPTLDKVIVNEVLSLTDGKIIGGYN